jgi:hypothetical protein
MSVTGLTIIISSLLGFIVASGNYSGTANFAYGQTSQIKSKDNIDSLDVQGIATKKVHVVDIDITYKVFGKGNPICLLAAAVLLWMRGSHLS